MCWWEGFFFASLLPLYFASKTVYRNLTWRSNLTVLASWIVKPIFFQICYSQTALMFSMLSILLFSHLLKPVFCGLKIIFSIWDRARQSEKLSQNTSCRPLWMYDSKNYDGFLVDISLSLLIPQASKCRKSNDFMVCTVIRPPKDHIDFFESLDISQETSNTLKKFKKLLKFLIAGRVDTTKKKWWSGLKVTNMFCLCWS